MPELPPQKDRTWSILVKQETISTLEQRNSHTRAVTADGQVICFGYNEYGQCCLRKRPGQVRSIILSRLQSRGPKDLGI